MINTVRARNAFGREPGMKNQKNDKPDMSDKSNDKLSIVLFSGTVDKLMAASVITAGATAMGKQVTLFLTFWGLMAFKKAAWKTNTRFSKDFEDYAKAAAQAMQAKKVPHWLDTLKQAMEIGEVKIKACGLTMDLFDMKHELVGMDPFEDATRFICRKTH